MMGKSLGGQRPSHSYQQHKEIGHRRPLWLREFNEEGVDGVRAGLKDEDWPEAKKILAREWLETREMEAWQAERPESKPYFRDKKWWIYLAGGILVAFMLFRLRRFF